MSKIIKKNGIIIDSKDLSDNYHVFVDNNGNDIYTCTLNQTNIKSNNNKFYIMQLLKHDSNNDYIVYTRYGRIGDRGVTNTNAFNYENLAINYFIKIFRQKTGNVWQNRENFIKKSNKYFMSQIDYEDDDSNDSKNDDTKNNDNSDKNNDKSDTKIICLLDGRLQSLLALISNINIIKYTMKEFNIDLRKMPLGKISKNQIENGYNILKEIADGIDDITLACDFEDLTSQFYTLIPSSFGRKKPPIISTNEQIKKYIDMLSVLTDLEVAGTILNNKDKTDMHPHERIYKQLNIDITPLLLSDDSLEYQMIKKYMMNTIAPTHNSYILELLDVMKIHREFEHQQFNDYGNNQLLFHGSRVANFMGIFSQGLRINNNAPKTGSMFGPGSYFSNSITKSANYCFTDKKNNIGIVLLCQVSLGNQYKRTSSQYITWLPDNNYQSTWGMGNSTTDPNDQTTIDNILVPYGKLVKKNNNNGLLYDEFIVYRENQIKIKYALKLKFDYK